MFDTHTAGFVPGTSLPSRERGLKSDCRLYFFSIIRSLPSRERGLKLFVDATHEGLGFVAPFAGAWIEIC